MTRCAGLAAEFADAAALTEAAGALHGLGYSRFEAYSPYPLPDLNERLGERAPIVPVLAGVAALVGASIAFGTQWWTSAVGYPLDVGGRPLFSWPAFVPATVIVAILWGAVGCFIGLLVHARLPLLRHPIFERESFRQLSDDRFFLLVEADDPRFAGEATEGELRELGATSIEPVPG